MYGFFDFIEYFGYNLCGLMLCFILFNEYDELWIGEFIFSELIEYLCIMKVCTYMNYNNFY
jgi:hypothetical protein